MAAAGLIVANLYYVIAEFNIPNADAGTITYLTQAGYAIGLFLMVPLGTKLNVKVRYVHHFL
jgi:hypothetical protein